MLKTKHFKEVYHVGTMDAANKGVQGFSLEGRGLSVSECPEAWKQIARLGGNPTWKLTKPDNQFLNFHTLDKSATAAVYAWGQSSGLVLQGDIWTVGWWDSEMEDKVTMTFESEAEANAEMEDDRELMKVTGWLATPVLTALSGHSKPQLPSALVKDFLVIAYAQHLGLDGVYWAERLDVLRHSAPRAVIFVDKLGDWLIGPMSR